MRRPALTAEEIKNNLCTCAWRCVACPIHTLLTMPGTCVYVDVFQDIWHAKKRITRHLLRYHADFSVARRNLTAIFARLKPGVNALTKEQYKQEMADWAASCRKNSGAAHSTDNDRCNALAKMAAEGRLLNVRTELKRVTPLVTTVTFYKLCHLFVVWSQPELAMDDSASEDMELSLLPDDDDDRDSAVSQNSSVPVAPEAGAADMKHSDPSQTPLPPSAVRSGAAAGQSVMSTSLSAPAAAVPRPGLHDNPDSASVSDAVAGSGSPSKRQKVDHPRAIAITPEKEQRIRSKGAEPPKSVIARGVSAVTEWTAKQERKKRKRQEEEQTKAQRRAERQLSCFVLTKLGLRAVENQTTDVMCDALVGQGDPRFASRR